MRCDSWWKIAARDIGRENRLGKLDATESLLEENKILVKFIRKLSFFFLSLSWIFDICQNKCTDYF